MRNCGTKSSRPGGFTAFSASFKQSDGIAFPLRTDVSWPGFSLIWCAKWHAPTPKPNRPPFLQGTVWSTIVLASAPCASWLSWKLSLATWMCRAETCSPPDPGCKIWPCPCQSLQFLPWVRIDFLYFASYARRPMLCACLRRSWRSGPIRSKAWSLPEEIPRWNGPTAAWSERPWKSWNFLWSLTWFGPRTASMPAWFFLPVPF